MIMAMMLNNKRNIPVCGSNSIGIIGVLFLILVIWSSENVTGFANIGRNHPSVLLNNNRVPSVVVRSATLSNDDNDNNSNNNSNKGGEDELLLLKDRVENELKEMLHCTSLVFKYVSQDKVTATDVVELCDEIDSAINNSANRSWFSQNLRPGVYNFSRYQLLTKLMVQDYDAYVATASFLSPSRIARMDLPNIQDVPYNAPSQIDEDANTKKITTTTTTTVDGMTLVDDCTLDDMEFEDSLLDKVLLYIFRKLVVQYSDGVGSSDKAGIEGLLEQGRKYMLKPDQTPEAQHTMVKNTLGGLMTPVLPPFYRIFMTGIVPDRFEKYVPEGMKGKQLGPWFYAPYLTSMVTPTFFGFLVGPSYPNRRIDGQRGGLVVEKCKFLQQSGCKGLCLNQCKIPAQEFFADNLGLDLTVKPNFETQECQWSFGEKPLPVDEDPSFPKGCLVGCESREAMANTYEKGAMGSCS